MHARTHAHPLRLVSSVLSVPSRQPPPPPLFRVIPLLSLSIDQFDDTALGTITYQVGEPERSAANDAVLGNSTTHNPPTPTLPVLGLPRSPNTYRSSFLLGHAWDGPQYHRHNDALPVLRRSTSFLSQQPGDRPKRCPPPRCEHSAAGRTQGLLSSKITAPREMVIAIPPTLALFWSRHSTRART
jgi:hypothetical protein